jgi:hypothetical protein
MQTRQGKVPIRVWLQWDNIQEMGLAVTQAQDAESKILALSEANQKIQLITQTIAGITEKTNLLALNAQSKLPVPVSMAADLPLWLMKYESWHRMLPVLQMRLPRLSPAWGC